MAGAANTVKTVNNARAATEQLKESQRHNHAMEPLALGQSLYQRPYREGLGLYMTNVTRKQSQINDLKNYRIWLSPITIYVNMPNY